MHGQPLAKAPNLTCKLPLAFLQKSDAESAGRLLRQETTIPTASRSKQGRFLRKSGWRVSETLGIIDKMSAIIRPVATENSPSHKSQFIWQFSYVQACGKS